MVRASRIHIGMMDQNTQQIASIRRAIKSMTDCLSQRRLKIVTANAKAIKMFELLRAWNHEVREQRERFQEAHDRRKEQQTAHAAPPQQPQALEQEIQQVVAQIAAAEEEREQIEEKLFSAEADRRS